MNLRAVDLHQSVTNIFEYMNSGTTTEFCVPDHGSRTFIMAKFRAFMQNPDLFRTTFLTFPDF